MIKDKIKGKEIIITDDYLSYNGKKICISEIVDFYYDHSYYNFQGGIEFRLITKETSLRISVSASNSIFQTKKTTENILKLENLARTFIPIATNAFVRNSLKKIE